MMLRTITNTRRTQRPAWTRELSLARGTGVRAQLLGFEMFELNGGFLVAGGHGWPFVDTFGAASVWHRSGWPCQEELGTRWTAWRKLTMP